MTIKTVKRSISMTSEMHDLLVQIAARRGREVTEVDLIREAINEYLEEQADIIGSRRNFHKSLQQRLDRLETSLTFHLYILMYLLAAAISDDSESAIEEAIVAAKRDSETLSIQIAAVRDLKDDV